MTENKHTAMTVNGKVKMQKSEVESRGEIEDILLVPQPLKASSKIIVRVKYLYFTI